MTRAKLRRIFWVGAATILVVAALIAIAAVLAGSFTSTDGKILGSLGSLLLAGTTAFAGLALIEEKRAPALGWASVAIGGQGLVVLLASIWSQSGDTLGRLAGTASVTLLAFLLATTDRLLLHAPSLGPLWLGTLGAISIATALTVVSIWTGGHGSGLARTIAAFWILSVLGWFLVPVLQRTAYATVEAKVSPAERFVVSLDGVDLLATPSPREGDIVADISDLHLTPGERLVLRRRPTG